MTGAMTGEGISVIIPAYNVEGFIGEAIASIQAQSRPVQEIIVVDDGSTDGTTACLKGFAGKDARLRVLACDRLGPGGARNLGLRAAGQPFIAFLDGDDAWPWDKVAHQMERFAAPDQPDVVSGLVQRFRELDPGSLAPAGEPGEIMANVNLGACLFRRRVFDAVGAFDERLRFAEDVDLIFRIREQGMKLVIMREVALYYRTRPGSMTQTKAYEASKEQGALRALKLSIARRRNAGRNLDLPPFTSLIDK